MKFENSITFARTMDRQDKLKQFRSLFNIPKLKGKTTIYFTGNSLGLQPKTTKKFIEEELNDWATLGVEGHLHAKRPWLYYHKFTKKGLAALTGAKPSEVVGMNQLTVNLHLMMVSFYRPTTNRFKIITEAGAFSSDQYAFESQVKLHGLNPDDTIIELKPRAGEYTLRTADIVQSIEDHADQLALVIFGGVQYYSGQFFDIKKITEAGHRAGAMVGLDLAHAIGNVPLSLHKDNVDFAVWCSYKYLNSGRVLWQALLFTSGTLTILN
jgi:kynureninase